MARALLWRPLSYLMIDYHHRSGDKEFLDNPAIPFEDIRRNMEELEFINRNLGGHAITIYGFKMLLGERASVSVCEIGCGGGDNLRAISKWCSKNRITAGFTGIDINENCIAFARTKLFNGKARFITADYRSVEFGKDRPDIIFSSLFCHHFSNEELIAMMRWMRENSTLGFFINDLHRHPLAYHFIKLVTRIFSRSYLVKHDAPLSVLRGFKKKEWESILQAAGIKAYAIQWKWAFRYLVRSRAP